MVVADPMPPRSVVRRLPHTISHDRKAVHVVKFAYLWNEKVLVICGFAFSALTRLVGRQGEHPACKNWVIRCWNGYLSGARCTFFAYAPADATDITKPHNLLPHSIQTGFTFLLPAYLSWPGKEAVKPV